MHLETAANLCVSWPDVKMPLNLTREGIHKEKRFIIWQKHIKEEHLNNLCLQAFNLAPKNGSPAFGNPHFDRCRHSPVKKIFVSFTRKYAVPRQIKPKILELSIRRRQSNLSSLYFCQLRRKRLSLCRFGSKARFDCRSYCKAQPSYSS